MLVVAGKNKLNTFSVRDTYITCAISFLFTQSTRPGLTALKGGTCRIFNRPTVTTDGEIKIPNIYCGRPLVSQISPGPYRGGGGGENKLDTFSVRDTESEPDGEHLGGFILCAAAVSLKG